MPVFIVLIFGIIEFGIFFRDKSTLVDAAAEGARWGAVQGPDPRYITNPLDDDEEVAVTADYSIVAAIREGTASLSKEHIERVVVYKGDNPRYGNALEQVPEACKTATTSVSGLCNVYVGNEAFLAVQEGNIDYFKCGTGLACGWRPQDRDDGPDPSEIDYIGVYIAYAQPTVTGFFGSSRLLEQATLLRLEPGAVE